jgi:hypothetical protein
MAELDDAVDDLRWCGRGRVVGPARPRLEGGVTVTAIAGHELGHPTRRHPVGPGHLTNTPLFGNHRGD